MEIRLILARISGLRINRPIIGPDYGLRIRITD